MEGGKIEDNPLKVMELTEAELATGLSWISQHSPSELGSNPPQPLTAHMVVENHLSFQSFCLVLPQN